MWFLFALITTCFWGLADLFYKKGAEEKDKFSHLKTTMVVGIVMGIHAIYSICFSNISYDYKNIIIYLPVSLMYISSMAVGYFGLKYLELSISSPIQNSSGAVTCILCFLILGQTMSLISVFGVISVCLGVFLLGVIEKHLQGSIDEDKKYKIGFMAFFMPIIYCILDSFGTFFDAYFLDDIKSTPLVNVTEETFEQVANTSYELTFLICAIIIFIYIVFIKKEKISIPKQKNRFFAAICETTGQFFYVYAMSGNGIIAAPMIASYCVVSIVLSRIFLKEKLTKFQYVSVAITIIGIVLLGIADA